MRYLILSACLFGLTLPASAQQPDPAQIQELERQQKQAEADRERLEKERATARKEITRLQSQLVTLGAQAETYEKTARAADARLSDLSKDETTLETQIYDNRQDLYDLLAALQRIERNPPPSLATRPDDSRAAAQAALLISTMTQRLRVKADELAGQLDDLQDVRANIETEKVSLAKTEAKLSDKRSEISTLIKSKQQQETKLGEQSDAAQKRAQGYADKANSLRELIARFEADANAAPRIKPERSRPQGGQVSDSGIPVPRIKPERGNAPQPLIMPDTGRFADARGKLRAPARGTIIRKYNARGSDGEKSKGITLSTRSGAQVLAPFSGRIEFAGEFKNYSRVVILNVGDGYFIVLTGMTESFGKKGQMVLSGEPLGRMGSRKPELYIELRKNGTPVNPVPWLGTNLG